MHWDGVTFCVGTLQSAAYKSQRLTSSIEVPSDLITLSNELHLVGRELGDDLIQPLLGCRRRLCAICECAEAHEGKSRPTTLSAQSAQRVLVV